MIENAETNTGEARIHLATTSWPLPPRHLSLTSKEVHIWRAQLDLPPSQVTQLYHLLSEDEKKRAKRFYRSVDRERFIVTHGLLRNILSDYLSIPPDQLLFQHGVHGKPYLSPVKGQQPLDFNLSHADTLVLYGIALNRRVGIDVERIDTNVEYERVATHFFSKHENDELSRLPEENRRHAFFNCWTHKEAYVKASGEGLALALHQFDVTLTPGQGAVLLDARHDPEEVSRWSFHTLQPGVGYVGALVVEGHLQQLRCWSYPL